MATAVTHRLYAVTRVDLWIPAELWHFILALMFRLSGAILPAQSEPRRPGESQLPHLHHRHPEWQRERSKTSGEALRSSPLARSVVFVDVPPCFAVLFHLPCLSFSSNVSFFFPLVTFFEHCILFKFFLTLYMVR